VPKFSNTLREILAPESFNISKEKGLTKEIPIVVLTRNTSNTYNNIYYEDNDSVQGCNEINEIPLFHILVLPVDKSLTHLINLKMKRFLFQTTEKPVDPSKVILKLM